MTTSKFNEVSTRTGKAPIVSIKKRQEGINVEKSKEYKKIYNAIYYKNKKEGRKEHISVRPKKRKSKEEYNAYVREYMRKRFGKNLEYLRFIRQLKDIFFNGNEIFC